MAPLHGKKKTLPPKNYNTNSSNYNCKGYFFYCYNGTVYSNRSNQNFSSSGYSYGTVYNFELKKSSKEIIMWRNKSKLGVAFKSIDLTEKLHPCFEFYDYSGSIEIINKDSSNQGGVCLI